MYRRAAFKRALPCESPFPWPVRPPLPSHPLHSPPLAFALLTPTSPLPRPRLAPADDRGVKFGLAPESVERVLVSSPPMVAFKYKASAHPPEGSAEAATLEVLRKPRDWC